MGKEITPCSFCRFWTGRSCMTSASPINCSQAKTEYYQHLANRSRNSGYTVPKKSLRKWDK
jgi:hypothetical protein